MRVHHRESDIENHDRGLDYDLPRLLQRRGMLKLVAGAGLAGTGLITLGACASGSTTSDAITAGRRAERASRGTTAGRPNGGRAAGVDRDQRHRQRRAAGGDGRPLSR